MDTSPTHAANNINGIGNVGRYEVYGLKEDGLTKAQAGVTRVWALVEPGRAYAIYVIGQGPADLTLELPAGAFRAEWINTLTGSVDKEEPFTHGGGARRLQSPDFARDLALRVKAE
jgi:hypothetical protein